MKSMVILTIISINLAITPVHADIKESYQSYYEYMENLSDQTELKLKNLVKDLGKPYKELLIGAKEELKKDIEKENAKTYINLGIAGINMNDQDRIVYAKALLEQIDIDKKPNQVEKGNKFFIDLFKKIIKNGKVN